MAISPTKGQPARSERDRRSWNGILAFSASRALKLAMSAAYRSGRLCTGRQIAASWNSPGANGRFLPIPSVRRLFVINMAHGGFLIIGAYLAYTMSPYLGSWGSVNRRTRSRRRHWLGRRALVDPADLPALGPALQPSPDLRSGVDDRGSDTYDLGTAGTTPRGSGILNSPWMRDHNHLFRPCFAQSGRHRGASAP